MSLRTAVRHLTLGEWEKAHTLAQADHSKLGAWAHAIVHLQEGDTANARYWFERAGRAFSADTSAEVRALAAALDPGSGD